jgi:hypothetical protein
MRHFVAVDQRISGALRCTDRRLPVVVQVQELKYSSSSFTLFHKRAEFPSHSHISSILGQRSVEVCSERLI